MFPRIARLMQIVAVLIALVVPARAQVPGYTKLFVFGGSMTDVGNDWLSSGRIAPVSPPYYFGRFSNGPLWVEYLALALGTPTLLPSLAGGSDFAFGGAQTGTTLVNTTGSKDLPAQLGYFDRSGQAMTPHSLVLMDVGTNDLAALARASGSLSQAQIAETIEQIIGNEIAFIDQIAQRGAKTVAVVTAGDLSKPPGFRAAQAPEQELLTSAVAAYNAQLAAQLTVAAARDGIALVPVDLFALTDAIVADPAAYGFSNVTDPCWTGTPDSLAGGTLCAATMTAQDTHLFWDSLHLTTAGHGMVAAEALSVLPAAP